MNLYFRSPSSPSASSCSASSADAPPNEDTCDHSANASRKTAISSSPIPPNVDPDAGAFLIIAESVIGSDYLKSFLAKLRNIFGGEVRSFEIMVQRSRREALQRLVAQAREIGCNAVINVRMETADIGGGTGTRKVPFAAILAWGTACRTR